MSTTFAVQAQVFLEQATSRKRNPVKPSTIVTWKGALNKWILPHIGDLPLETVSNPPVRDLVEKMYAANLSAQTINSYVGIVKLVVKSALNEQGEPEFPRHWNSNFMDLPVICNQRQPCFSAEAVGSIVKTATGQHKVLCALLAGTGLRIGEALGLEIKHIGTKGPITVVQSVYGGVIQSPKTRNAVRQVDLTEGLANLLWSHIGNRTEGFVFRNQNGKPFSQTNLLRRKFHPLLKQLGIEKQGYHGFRRYRCTWLRKRQCPEDILRFWLGHSATSISDHYSKLSQDVDYRRTLIEKVGLGFLVSY
jgi:integrase